MQVNPRQRFNSSKKSFQLTGEADPMQRAWVEISPSSITRNVCLLKSRLAERCQLMAVVKADGYGHGSSVVASAAIEGGASQLGVATLREGIELREKGFDVPILLLGSLIDSHDFELGLQWNLMPTVSSMREAAICQKVALQCQKRFDLQLKIDTGMSRLGCDLATAPKLIKSIRSLEGVRLCGIYSHLALADGQFGGESERVTELQNQRFYKVLESLPNSGRDFIRHLSNSAGTLRGKDFHYDMVRVGLALYGYSPIDDLDLSEPLDLYPALALRARVTLIREVPKGVGVSYGHRFVTERATRLAIVGIGYADGIPRSLSGRISALINGQRVPQVGAITMDQLVLDVTDCIDLSLGDVVTLLGTDGSTSISPKEWCVSTGLIPWEVLCSFKHRLPRLVV